MKILTFENQDWQQIPEQDNPTWDIIDHPVQGKIRRNECIIICKVLPYEAANVGVNGYLVIHVPINGEIIRKGLFWKLSDAELFAEALTKED